MEYSLSLNKFTTTPLRIHHRRVGPVRVGCGRKNLIVARAGGGPSHCEFSSSSSPLNTPLEPNSPTGRFLSGVFLNHRHFFNLAVSDELKHLSSDRDAAFDRMLLSSDSDDAILHRYLLPPSVCFVFGVSCLFLPL